MPFFYEDVAQAALGDVNILESNGYILKNQIASSLRRSLKGVYLGLGGAADDAAVEVLVGDRSIHQVYTVDTDGIITKDKIVMGGGYIPPKSEVVIQCTDAMAQAMILGLFFTENGKVGGRDIRYKPLAGGVHLLENLGTMTLNSGDGMEQTNNLKMHRVDSKNDRVITEACLCDGTAALDAKIGVQVGGEIKATLHNSLATRAITDDYMLPTWVFVPRGMPIDIVCLDAFAADTYIAMNIFKVANIRSR